MTTDSNKRDFRKGLRTGLGMLALVAVAGLTPGCIIDGNSGPPAQCFASPVTLDWVVTAAAQTKSCAEVGATTVSIMVDDVSMIADFDCNAHAGTTDPVTGGRSHNISLLLSDAAGNPLSQLDPVRFNFPCDGSFVDLGTVEFSLTP